jgi:hypothetical protein
MTVARSHRRLRTMAICYGPNCGRIVCLRLNHGKSATHSSQIPASFKKSSTGVLSPRLMKFETLRLHRPQGFFVPQSPISPEDLRFIIRLPPTTACRAKRDSVHFGNVLPMALPWAILKWQDSPKCHTWLSLGRSVMVCENGRPLGLGKHSPPQWTTQTERFWFLTPFVFPRNGNK